MTSGRTDENYSWYCGVEGSTNDTEVQRLRKRQAKNLLTTLLIWHLQYHLPSASRVVKALAESSRSTLNAVKQNR